MLGWTLRMATVILLASAWLALALAPGGIVDRFLDRQRSEAAGAARAAALQAVPVPNESVFRRARDGHFYVEAQINGASVRFLVDTGATYVSLSPEDARAAGVRVFDSDYTLRTMTANGVSRVAPVTLRQVELDQLRLFDVRAVVMERPMPVSLLGMSFLSRLQGYETRNDELVLRW